MNNKSKNKMAVRTRSSINTARKSSLVRKNPIGEKRSKRGSFSGKGKILRRKMKFVRAARIPAIMNMKRMKNFAPLRLFSLILSSHPITNFIVLLPFSFVKSFGIFYLFTNKKRH